MAPIPLSKPFDVLEIPLIVRYTGVFDYDGLYKMMHAWLVNKRFIFHEDRYKDKVSTPFGNEVEIKWTSYKKVTEFIKEWVMIEFHLWDYSEVEVIRDGKKMKMAKARIEIKFFAKLELDYAQRFTGDENDNFSKKLGQFYVEHIVYWDWRIRFNNVLEYSMYDFHTKVKKFLNMGTSDSMY